MTVKKKEIRVRFDKEPFVQAVIKFGSENVKTVEKM